MIYINWSTNNNTMDQNRKKDLEEAQHRDEIEAINEFTFPFPRFDIIPRVGVVIKLLQRFRVVHTVALDLD
jgi:hypothetical protein